MTAPTITRRHYDVWRWFRDAPLGSSATRCAADLGISRQRVHTVLSELRAKGFVSVAPSSKRGRPWRYVVVGSEPVVSEHREVNRKRKHDFIVLGVKPLDPTRTSVK